MALRSRLRLFLLGSTAEAVAVFRAAGALLDDDVLRGPDDMAARLVPWAPRLSALTKVPGLRRLTPRLVESLMPGSVGFELVRSKYMDLVVREEIRDGAGQLVILGAGWDSRACRLAGELAAASVFEVDQPAMSSRKHDRVRAVLGRDAPANVHYVPADLEACDLGETLAESGFDHTRRTVVVCSGVLPYLKPATADAVLRWVGAAPPGSCVVFDYCWQEILDGTADLPFAAALRDAVAARGEPWLSGIPRHGVHAHLADRGLSVDEIIDSTTARERFLRSRDRSYRPPMWDFGGLARASVPGAR